MLVEKTCLRRLQIPNSDLSLECCWTSEALQPMLSSAQWGKSSNRVPPLHHTWALKGLKPRQDVGTESRSICKEGLSALKSLKSFQCVLTFEHVSCMFIVVQETAVKLVSALQPWTCSSAFRVSTERRAKLKATVTAHIVNSVQRITYRDAKVPSEAISSVLAR